MYTNSEQTDMILITRETARKIFYNDSRQIFAYKDFQYATLKAVIFFKTEFYYIRTLLMAKLVNMREIASKLHVQNPFRNFQMSASHFFVNEVHFHHSLQTKLKIIFIDD